MPEDKKELNNFPVLCRLVSYKIHQLKVLNRTYLDIQEWDMIQGMFKRENSYAVHTPMGPLQDNYEKAMWSFYELLETISLKKLDTLKKDVYSQIRQIEVKRDMGLM